MKFKKWTDYSTEELLKLTLNEKEWDKFFELQCASEGIPFIPKDPGAPPNKLKFAGDIIIYKIKDLYFDNKQDAELIYKHITASRIVSLNYSDYPSVTTVEPNSYNYPLLEEKLCYSNELLNKRKVDVQTNKNEIELWQTLWDNWNNINNKRNKLYKTIMEPINKLKSTQADYNNMKLVYNKYYKLTEQNRKLALNILRKTNPEWYSKFPEFFTFEEQKGVKNDQEN